MAAECIYKKGMKGIRCLVKSVLGLIWYLDIGPLYLSYFLLEIISDANVQLGDIICFGVLCDLCSIIYL